MQPTTSPHAASTTGRPSAASSDRRSNNNNNTTTTITSPVTEDTHLLAPSPSSQTRRGGGGGDRAAAAAAGTATTTPAAANATAIVVRASPTTYKTLADVDAASDSSDEYGDAAAHARNEAEVVRRRNKEKKVLLGAMLFCLVFMIVEFASGVLAHSLALLTDATHLLTDVASYGLSIGALIAAGKAASKKYNYGWSRAEVLGTLISIFTIWALVAWILIEAFSRMYNVYECSHVPSALERLLAEQDRRAVARTGGDGTTKKQPQQTTPVATLRPRRIADVLRPHQPRGWLDALRGGDNEGGGSGSRGGDEAMVEQMLSECHQINSMLMIVVGVLGMAVNVVCASILYIGGSHGHSHGGGAGHGHEHAHEHAHEHEHEHEHAHEHEHGHDGGKRMTGFAVSAAFLHALGDCVQSVGVILAGVFIYIANRLAFGVHSYRFSIYNLADPLCSVFFALVTLNMTRPILHDLFGILMESTPPNVNYRKLDHALRRIDGVVDLHDLHVWSLSADYVALSAHLVADNGEQVLQQAQDVCKRQFGITHTTIQVDTIATGVTRCAATCSPPPHDLLDPSASSTH